MFKIYPDCFQDQSDKVLTRRLPEMLPVMLRNKIGMYHLSRLAALRGEGTECSVGTCHPERF
jgi:hypothetical protein